MTALWPAGASTNTVPSAVPRATPVPSTGEVLARAMAQSQRRGSRVARWRTARRWTVYHAWRHVLPVVLALAAPSSQYLLWPNALPSGQVATAPVAPAPAPPSAVALPTAAQAGTAPAAAEPAVASLATPEAPAPEEWSPVLALSTQLVPVPSAPPPNFAVPTQALILRADSSLHSQEP
jgi:hypothetical protein